MTIHLDNLPRTIQLHRADALQDAVPEGRPYLRLLDQTKLPYEETYIEVQDWQGVIDCIKSLVVRGAPAIGIAGAAAMAIRAAELAYSEGECCMSAIEFEGRIQMAADEICASRPTAVNLAWAVGTCMDIVREESASGANHEAIEQMLYEHVKLMIDEDENANRKMGAIGAALLPENARILTHCNAGSLATAFFGTALGVVYAAAEGRGVEMVYADETRPVGQGKRLTAWELSRAGIPVTLICDDMAAYVMSKGLVDAVLVGADRIAANGDVANKVGTLGVAVIASRYGIPVYVVAPTSTIDASIPTGDGIPIEQRDASEVLERSIGGVQVLNPAFDVTPASLVAKIVTERGAFDPSSILKALN